MLQSFDERMAPNHANGNEAKLVSQVIHHRWAQGIQQSFFHSLGTCAFDGLLYACGGYDGASCLSSVERFDPLTGVWSSCPAMSTRRRYCRVAVLGNCIYSLGGFDSSNYQSSVERFDPRMGSWYDYLSEFYCYLHSLTILKGCQCLAWLRDEAAVESPLWTIFIASVEVTEPCAWVAARDSIWGAIHGKIVKAFNWRYFHHSFA